MATPRVTPLPAPRPAHESSDDFGVMRTPRQPPYRRPTQRELVRAALLAEGAFSDYHGDRHSS